MSDREYNLQNFFIVGNPNYTTNPEYSEDVANNTVLSPYNKIEVKTLNQTYPSLIQYLLTLRLCYKQSKEELEKADIDQVRDVFVKYEKKCEGVFKKYGKSYKIKTSASEFIKEGFNTVQEYLLDKTEKGLNILFELVAKDSGMKNALINSGNKKIIFHDPDKILGDGLDKSGANLFGKKLEEVRKFLQSNYTRDCISTNSLKNIVTLNVEKLTKQDDFNSFEKWAFDKLQFVCKIIANFFEYLCMSRDGYMQVSIPPIIINPYINPKSKSKKETILVLTNDTSYDNFFINLLKTKDGKEPEKIKNYDHEERRYNGWEIKKEQLANVLQLLNSDGGRVSPRITSQMSLYCIKDILNCGIFNTFEGVSFPNPDADAVKAIAKLIQRNIQNPGLMHSVSIDALVARDVYQYVFIIAEYIMLQAISKDTDNKNYDDYVKISKNNEDFVINTKRDYFNHGFDTDEENAIAQFILYTITTISDYLDLDVMSDNEINFCIDLLNINQNVKTIPSINRLTEDNNKIHINIINQMFSEKGLIVNESECKKVANLIATINENMDNKIIENRIYFFSNFI